MTTSNFPKIGSPATRALEAAGYTNLKQLTKVTEAELGQLHGMGPKAVRILHETLTANGLSFRKPTKGGATDKTIRTHLDNIRADDGETQFKAYDYLMKETEKPVDWAYEAWDEIVDGLTHKDNHVRAIMGQLFSNLAKSDRKGKIFKDFDKLLNVTKDERFVTARHTLQNLWRVGVISKKHQKMYLDGLSKRFGECVTEKNCKLIRYDILVSMRNVYNQVNDEAIREKALELIETENDLKHKKKYTTVWKKA